MTVLLLILHMKLEISLTIVYLGMDQTWRPKQLASQVSRLKPTGLLFMGLDERTGLHSLKLVTRDELLSRI